MVDPNSGAAPQPGGYASAPVVEEAGVFVDAAVADEITEAQAVVDVEPSDSDVPDEEILEDEILEEEDEDEVAPAE